MLEIHHLGDARFGREQFFAWVEGNVRNVTARSAEAAAIARMNGRCQMTSPIPRLTWMTAVDGTGGSGASSKHALYVEMNFNRFLY